MPNYISKLQKAYGGFTVDDFLSPSTHGDFDPDMLDPRKFDSEQQFQAIDEAEMADQAEARAPGAAIQSFGGLEGYAEFLRSQGVGADTIRRVLSGELPMDNRSRMKRAREMGLDTQTPFRRVDVPGRTTMTRPELVGTPGRSAGLVYAAPTYRQAAMGNQTGGQARYPLLFPEGILGLHPHQKLKSGDDLMGWLNSTANDLDHLRYPNKIVSDAYSISDKHSMAALADAITALNSPGGDPGKARKLLRDSFLRTNRNAMDYLDERMDDLNALGDEDGLAFQDFVGDASRQHLANSRSGRVDDGNYEWDAHDQGMADELAYRNMDFGQADMLKRLGATGSIVQDETGMSVASFYPERVRHQSLSALDPKARKRSNIFQSLLAPAAGAGAAASMQGEE